MSTSQIYSKENTADFLPEWGLLLIYSFTFRYAFMQ